MPLTRVRDAQVEPVELWDTLVRGRSLFAWQASPAALPGAVAEAVRAMHRGDAAFENTKLRPRPRAESFSRCFLTGAGANLFLVARALEAAGFPCRVSSEPAFPGVLGAMRIAGEVALGIDVGQTGVKAWQGSRRARISRDWSALPLFDPPPPRDVQERCEEKLLRMMVSAVREVAPSADSPIVLALPTQVFEDGVLGGCTYAYPPANRTLVPRFLAEAGLVGQEVHLLNDAELAGHSALPDSEGAELVLTFGFGIGGALVLERLSR